LEIKEVISGSPFDGGSVGSPFLVSPLGECFLAEMTDQFSLLHGTLMLNFSHSKKEKRCENIVGRGRSNQQEG
jgi:hypothetical protein